MEMKQLNKEPDDAWTIPLAMETKDGRPIHLLYEVNVERENRGFIVDRIIAHVDNQECGFLKIENIPKSMLAKFYPSGCINYAAQIGGYSILPWDKPNMDLRTASIEELKEMAGRLHSYGATPPCDFDDHDGYDRWFEQTLKKARWFREMDKGFRNFVDFHVDKPFTAFASTEIPGEDLNDRKKFCGKGIGTAMYLAAFYELEKQGLRLRKSNTISSSATRLWDSLSRKGYTYEEEGQIYGDGAAVRLEYISEGTYQPMQQKIAG